MKPPDWQVPCSSSYKVLIYLGRFFDMRKPVKVEDEEDAEEDEHLQPKHQPESSCPWFRRINTTLYSSHRRNRPLRLWCAICWLLMAIGILIFTLIAHETVVRVTPLFGRFPTITLITGTHLAGGAFNPSNIAVPQHNYCSNLSDALYAMWVAKRLPVYQEAKQEVQHVLGLISKDGISCLLLGTSQMSFSFPLSSRPGLGSGSTACDADSMMIRKKPSTDHSPKYDYFSYRPDLVSFVRMVQEAKLGVRMGVIVSKSVDDASFSHESCRRYLHLLQHLPFYQQRLLWKSLAELERQLLYLVREEYSLEEGKQLGVVQCRGEAPENSEQARKVASWLGLETSPELLCQDIHRIKTKQDNTVDDASLFATMAHMRIMYPQFPSLGKLLEKKTVFDGPRFVFVAGVEGVGHHAMLELADGRFHTKLQSVMHQYMDTSTKASSTNVHKEAFHSFVSTLKHVRHSTSGPRIYFLNPDAQERNMFSFPYGCVFRRTGRSLCNPDLSEIARICETAGVDCRFLVLERDYELTITADSIHRNQGNVFMQAKVLQSANFVLQSALDTIDERFYMAFRYETMLEDPALVTEQVCKHLSISNSSSLYGEFRHKFQRMHAEYYKPNRTKSEIPPRLSRYVSDMELPFEYNTAQLNV